MQESDSSTSFKLPHPPKCVYMSLKVLKWNDNLWMTLNKNKSEREKTSLFLLSLCHRRVFGWWFRCVTQDEQSCFLSILVLVKVKRHSFRFIMCACAHSWSYLSAVSTSFSRVGLFHCGDLALYECSVKLVKLWEINGAICATLLWYSILNAQEPSALAWYVYGPHCTEMKWGRGEAVLLPSYWQ